MSNRLDRSREFKIAIRRKIPYVTNLFLIVGGICFLVVILFDLFFYPFRNAGPETRAALFYWLVPEFWKKVYVFSVIGLFSTALFSVLFRYYKAAILRFYDDEIVITGKAFNTTIPVKTIRRIICNDATKADGESRQKLTITMELRRVRKTKSKALAIRLKHYCEADAFMEQLLKYETVDIKMYELDFLPIHMDES